ANVVAAAVLLLLDQIETDPVALLLADGLALEAGIGTHHCEVAPRLVVEGDGPAHTEVHVDQVAAARIVDLGLIALLDLQPATERFRLFSAYQSTLAAPAADIRFQNILLGTAGRRCPRKDAGNNECRNCRRSLQPVLHH